MNKRQKRVLWVGIVVFALMGLFPPSMRRWESYGFILDLSGSQIGYGKLFVQWIVLAVVVGSLIYILKDKKDTKSEDEGYLQRKPINWKRGFRRVTLCCATLGAVTGGILAYIVTLNAIQAKVDKARTQNRIESRIQQRVRQRIQELDFSKVGIKEEDERTTAYETEIKQQPNRPRDIAKAEKNFWLRLLPQSVICLAILTGLVVGAFAFCGIWLIYYLIEWLILGFAEDKKKDEQDHK